MPPKLLPSLQTPPKSPAGPFKPDQNAVDRPDLFSVPMDVIYGLLGMDANSTGRKQNGKPAQLSAPNAIGQTLSSGLPIAGASKLLYSRLEKAAQALPEFAHPNRIFSLLKSNASGEEMGLRGIEGFLKSQGERKVSKAQVLKHLEENPLPDVTKSVLTPGGRQNHAGYDLNKTQYGHPGLITPMEAKPKDYRENLYHINQPGEVYGAPHFDNTDIESLFGPVEGNQNLLMHSRTTERDIPGRGRILMGEEDQSDWHQAGRKQGYRSSDESTQNFQAINDRIRALYTEQDELLRSVGGLSDASPEVIAKWNELKDAQDELIAQSAQLRMGHYRKVPDAPYKQEWPNILWKDQLGQAVEDPNIKGYGWTQGREQNRRSGRLTDDWVNTEGEFEGDPEKPMQDFYDVRKRNAIDKFLRQHGGRVEEITVPGVPKQQPPKDYAVTPRGEIQELPSPDEWGEMGDEGDIVASVWPQFRSMNEDLPRGFQVIDVLERQHQAKGLTIPTEVKIWYAALPDHIKESIKRGGIPFLMALWATHQAGQDNNNMSAPNPPNEVNQ